MKKILIFYASYGGGHLAAANSIKKYLDKNYKNVESEIIDCIKYVNKPLEKITTGAYREMAKKTPKLWGKLYFYSEKGLLFRFSKTSNKLMAKKLYLLIKEKNPDIIISTHPFSSQMCSFLKEKKYISCKIATIMTDFAIHKQWLIGHKYTDYFFVSNNSMKQDMINYGISSDKIFITGIPISDRFFEEFDKQKIYEHFKLDPNKKTILFFGGGEFGLGRNKTIKFFKIFIENLPNYQIVAIAGKNKNLKKSFKKIVKDTNSEDTVKVLGFTNKIPELMNIALLVVSKPGGISTTETLACELPIIIINPIPGQEEKNAEFLEKNHVGVWIKSINTAKEIITFLFSSNDKFKKMKKNTKLLSKKTASKNICETILK